MRIKSRNILEGALFIVFAGFWLSLFHPPTAQAYTCDYSGKNSNGKEGEYKLEMEGIGGSCYYMAQDQIDNSKKKAVVNNGRIVVGEFTCTDGTVLRGQDCYAYKKVYTAYKPTYDDGTEIDNLAFQNACQAQPTYIGMHYNYNSDVNACSAGFGCSDLYGDSGKDRAAGGFTGLPIGDCRRVGAGTNTAGDFLGNDPTTSRVQECTNAGASFNGQNHQCDWTEQTCSAKNSGQGVWVNGQCRAFSDFTSKEACESKDVKGEFKQDPNDPTHWECVKPGTQVNDNSPNGQTGLTPKGLDRDALPKGNCAGIQTNIIVNCPGSNALGDILKIAVQVLSYIIGIAAVGGIAWASVLYAKAQDNESNVQQAKELIRNVVIGLLLYVFMVALLNWLVPGGVIGN